MSAWFGLPLVVGSWTLTFMLLVIAVVLMAANGRRCGETDEKLNQRCRDIASIGGMCLVLAFLGSIDVLPHAHTAPAATAVERRFLLVAPAGIGVLFLVFAFLLFWWTSDLWVLVRFVLIIGYGLAVDVVAAALALWTEHWSLLKILAWANVGVGLGVIGIVVLGWLAVGLLIAADS